MDIIHKLKIMSQDEKTYTLEEMDEIMKKHIQKEADVLRKNLREKRKNNEIEYV